MKTKNKVILLLLISAFLFIVSLSAVSSQTVVGDNFTALNNTIQANNNVELDNNITVSEDEKTSFTEGIEISKNLTIDGRGHAIDGNGSVRLFKITSDDVVLTLKNITLKNGNYFNGNGGAIYSDYNVTLTLNNKVFFINNIAEVDEKGTYGGAIYSLFMVNITSNDNIVFLNNMAAEYGGAIFAYGNVTIYSTGGNVIFNDNIASHGGNAIYSVGDINITNIDGNVIFNNHNGLNSMLFSNKLLVTANNIIFSNNSFSRWVINCNTINITNAIFYGNQFNRFSEGTPMIRVTDFEHSNLSYCFWGLNYNTKEDIQKAHLIGKLNEESSEYDYFAPDNWILLNLTLPKEVITGSNNVFTLEFNILTDGVSNSTYNDFNGSIVVKTNYVDGIATEFPVVPGNFSVVPRIVGNSSLRILSYYTGEEIIKKVIFDVEPLNSTLKVLVDDSVYGDMNKVIVYLVGDDNKTITATVNLTINNKKYSVNVVNGLGELYLPKLAANNYTISAFYAGDKTHNNVTNSTKFTIAKKEITLHGDDLTIISGESGNLTITTFSGFNGFVTVEYDGKSKQVKLTNGVGILLIDDLSVVGFYPVNISLIDNENFTARNASATIRVIDPVGPVKEDTFINVIANVYNQIVSVNVTLVDSLGSGIEDNITISIYQNGILFTRFDAVTDENGSYSFVYDFNAGNYGIVVSYGGNEERKECNNMTTFKVDKVSTSLIIETTSITYGETGVLNITMIPKINVSVSVFVDGVILLSEVNLTDGFAQVDLTGFNAGEHIIVVKFDGDDNYNPSRSITNWIVNKVNTSLDIETTDITYGDKGLLTIKMDPELNTNVLLFIDGNQWMEPISLVDGFAQVNLAGFNAGQHVVVVRFDGGNNYESARKVSNWNVGKANTTFVINTEDIKVGEGETITVNVGNNLDGVVILKGLLDTDVSVLVTNGTGIVLVNDLEARDYDIYGIFVPVNNNYNILYNSSSFSVTDKEQTSIIVNIEDVYYIGDVISEVVSVIPSDATGVINVYSDGYLIASGDLVNGSAFFTYTVPDMPGQWKLEVVYSGDDKYYGSSISKDIIVMHKDNILFVEDLEKYYGQDYPLIAVLLDSTGKALSGENVTFTINGKTYTRTTNDYGVVAMNINLNPGDYTVEVASGNLTETVTVTVLNTVSGEDVVKMYKNGTQYYASFLDSEGNALANTNVTFNINGVFYTRTTDAKGVAKLNINLLPGSYVITAYNPATGELFSNNINVLPTLVGDDLIKPYSKAACYEIKAFDNKGNPLAGANVTINIHGVFYNKITDVNGVARLDINLAPGEYIATAYYNGYATSNKITVLEG